MVEFLKVLFVAVISYNSRLALLFMKCFYNFFWDKRKSYKGEMLVGDGGKGKTNRQAWRSSWRLMGAPRVAGAPQRSCAPEGWWFQSVMETTSLWQGLWIRTVKAIASQKLTADLLYLRKERKMQTINSKLGIQVKELHTHGEEKRKWFFKMSETFSGENTLEQFL